MACTRKWGGQPRLMPAPKHRPAVAQRLPAPPPPPSTPSPMAVPARKHADGANHCRWYNFGHASGRCAFGDACKYWHVDEQNWDHGLQEQVEAGDKREVTPEVVEKLRPFFEAVKAKKRSEKRGSAAEEPPAQRQKTDEPVENMTEPLLQQWLDNARNEDMMPTAAFLRDIVKLKFDEGVVKKRYPYEEATLFDADNAVLHRVQVHQETDIVWCAMLYGKSGGIMPHLSSCLLLGYQLRYVIRPLLAKKGIRMENVLFVTETALEEDAFRAVSFMWSMKFCKLPEVHQNRVMKTSGHLKSDGIEPEHVFLKVEAFKMDADLSIISDLDVVITNAAVMAKRLADFCTGGKYAEWLTPGRVAVMQRARSRVDIGSEPQEIDKHSWSRHDRSKGYMPISYCFALLRPSKELTERYEDLMRSAGQSSHGGPLSDQDLLGEVVSGEFLLLNHDMIAFPSWWVHADLYAARGAEAMQYKRTAAYEGQSWHEYGRALASDFGAVHLSRCFDFTTEAQSLEQKKAFFKWTMSKMGGLASHIKVKGGEEKVCMSHWIEVVGGFWTGVRAEYLTQKKNLAAIVQQSVGHLRPQLGMAKCLFAVTILPHETLEEARAEKPASSSTAPWHRKRQGE